MHAKLLEERGRFGEAAQKLTEALAGEETEAASLWRRLNALGRLHLRLGDAARAKGLFEAAQAAAESIRSDAGKAAALTNRAAVLVDSGQADQALQLLAQAEAAADAAQDALARARIAYNRGRVLLGAHRAAEAQVALLEASRLSSELGWEEGVALAHQALIGAGLGVEAP
jgi:tetratricopeptide (TPR) repeat protein